jgi:ubiquinone/menaquinone biosynthesis C-methylase UbiE
MNRAEPGHLGDLYAGIAERYDRFHGPFGEHDPAEVSFFRTLIQENRVERVLDCACGTGRHLHLLHALECEVMGSDISGSMLAQAERNLAALGIHVPLRQVDYRELPEHVGGTYDAVLCLSSSILHMSAEAEVVRAFRSMRRVLRKGGILVLTQGTTDKQWAEKPRFVLAVNERNVSRLFVIDYEGPGARYHVLDISHGEKTRGLEVWSVHYPRVYLRDDQERLLHEAGFERLAFYGSYGFDAYDKDASQQLIAVAWR